MSDRAVLYINMKRINITKTQERTSGVYLTTYHNGIDWPEGVRMALNASRSYWDRPRQLSLGIISLMGGGSAIDEVGLSVDFDIDNIKRVSLPIIVVDLGRRQVAFAALGDENDPAKWYSHSSFANYVEQLTARYPVESLHVYHLYRTDKVWRDEQRDVVVLAFSEKHARHLAADQAGDEGHEVWLGLGDKVGCEIIDPATALDKTPRVICRDLLEGI